MFQKLTDFSYKRTTKQALGFYIAYLILIVITGALLGGLIGLSTPTADIGVNIRAGNMLSVFICVSLSFAILLKKKLANDFGLILVALLSGLLAVFGGGLFGLIPPAYLSTKK